MNTSLWEQFIYSPSVQLEKLSQTHPQATVSRWNFYHPIATRICLPQWYEKNIFHVPEKFAVQFCEQPFRSKNNSISIQAVRSDAVFERYAEFFLAETAPPRPLGPKGEVYVPSAGKI